MKRLFLNWVSEKDDVKGVCRVHGQQDGGLVKQFLVPKQQNGF